MRVGVIGGGIGGLAVAIGLRRVGIDAEVFEQAPAFGSVGAGIVLSPNTMRALDWLGAGDHIRSINTPVAASTYSDLSTGEEIFRTVLGERAAERWGRHLYTTHRSDLVAALASCLPAGSLHLGRHLDQVVESASEVVATFSDGSVERFDLMIGADGLKSSVRRALGIDTDAIFTGYLAWRTTFDASRLATSLPSQTALWGGPGRHVVRYPIRKGAEIYSAFYVPADEIHRETWEVSGDIDDLRASFEGCCAAVSETLAAIDKAFITGIFYRAPLDRWHSRRIVLTGDAAHSVLPTSGSGSGLALEDAVMLARQLERHGVGQAEAAFSGFQARRWTRATRIQAASRVDLDAFHETDEKLIAARDGRYRGMGQLDPMGELKWSWIYDYDVSAAADAPVGESDQPAEYEPPMRAPARQAFDAWSTALTLEDRARGWIGQRTGYERFLLGLERVPDDVAVTSIDCNGVLALRVVPAGGGDGPCILHLHGGGFTFGSPDAAVALAARLARAARGWALVPAYRLAPEHPFPAAIEDVERVWRWANGGTHNVAVSGECAGAGLAVALALRCITQKLPDPAMLALFSPFLDPRLRARSIDANARRDPWMSRARLTEMAGSYLQDHDPFNPGISVLDADLSGLPPVRLWSAASEALHDDALRLSDAVTGSGGDVVMVVVEDSVPSFVLFDGLPETKAAITDFGREIADMCRKAIASGRGETGPRVTIA